MVTTPVVVLVFNRRHTATATHEAAVELRVSFKKQQKFMATGIRLLPNQWRRGTVVNRADSVQINQLLDQLVIDVRKCIIQMVEEGNIDIFSIPDRLKRLRVADIGFIEFCEKRAEVRRFGKSSDSKSRYNRFLLKFREWGGITEWSDITEEKIISFEHYLATKGMKPYSRWNNYHRFLNSFILDAICDGLLRRNPYKWVNIKKEKSSGGIGKHLVPEEFQRIKNVALSTDSLERVRDLFVFQTYTCLSYADLATFDVKKIQVVKGMKVYVGQRGKGISRGFGKYTVPLLKPALDILAKYKNKLPIISNEKYNQYLKVVAQAAGIDKPLSTHWARHTGATLLLNSGIDMRIVSKILGHSSTKITEQVYAKLLDETVVDAINDYEKENI